MSSTGLWDTEDGLTGGTSHTDADYSCLTPATRPTSSTTTSTSFLKLFTLFLKIYQNEKVVSKEVITKNHFLLSGRLINFENSPNSETLCSLKTFHLAFSEASKLND